MSTFRGVVQEFPDIRIDFFRPVPGLRPPRKCFLSHVHSDHLVGLETPSFHNCFIYCSAATREILLRLEKYPQRLNFQQGILEKPPKVTYKHLDKLLKTIPLETSTRIELEPGNDIQVTLFDANHCTGAVMFLIEGDNKAILYTGDIRSEPWFVNNLTRNPFLIEYTCGLKTIDCIYLDTSNTVDIPFPTKSDGLRELLQKVSKYPADTVFHFTAWTFGYEEVWMALSRALKSQIHVDEYKMRLYASLRGKPHDPKDATNDKHLSGPFLAHEGPALAGYKCGNAPQLGCLTSDPNTNVRIHSCEKGLHCDKINDKTIWVRPIIARTKHGEMAEVGVGGGGGDLSRHLDLVLDTNDVIDEFLGLFANTEDLVKIDIKRMLSEGLRSQRTVISLDDMGLDPKQGDISLTKITEALARSVAEKKNAVLSEGLADKVQTEALPRVITFPYSRHSSYAELCHLVRVFNPKDVYPCTVDEANWDEEVSMENLFGQQCSATKFRHDNEMRELHAVRQLQHETQQSQTTATSELSSQMLPPSSPVQQKAQTSKVYSLRRNYQGQLRFYDADGNEKVPSAEQLQKELAEVEKTSTSTPHDGFGNRLGGMLSGVHSTPPKDIIAVSPGSASQNLRRKAIHEGLEGQVKRARLSRDGLASSPSAESSVTTPQKARNLSAVIEISDESDDADAPTPGSDADSAVQSVEGASIPNASANQTSNGEGSQLVRDPYVREYTNTYWDEFTTETFLDEDKDDKITITRCKDCGHEMWTAWMTPIGFCTNCEKDPRDSRIPYYEIIDSESGRRPEIYEGYNALSYLEGLGPEYQTRKNIVGDYIDDHSDAYDTVDDEPDYRSEYDSEDSFVDDASIHSSQDEAKDEKPSNEDSTADYEDLFKQLQRKHNRLKDRYEGVMQNFVYSDYEYDSSSSEEMYDSDIDDVLEEVDELGAVIVDVVPPNPEVAELVLSQAQEQSQESEVSPDRIQDRVNAFEAAAGENWNNISLVSAGDNHTEVEIEL